MQLHQLGYRYTGDASLYDLTWIEIMRLVDASQLIEDMASGVRDGDLNKLNKYHNRVKQKSRKKSR